MGLSPRLAFASGAAAIGACALLLAGRIEGSAFAVLLLAAAARAAAAGSRLRGGPVATALATRSLARQALLAPAWALVLATAAVRAGGGTLSDVRGANAVLGPAVVRGEPIAVVGAWLALLAGVLAALAPGLGRAETEAPPGARAVVPSDGRLTRLEAIAFAAQAALLATLFVGPQVTGAADLVAWAAALAGIALGVVPLGGLAPRPLVRLVARALGAPVAARPEIPALAAALGGIALALVLAGGGA